MRQQPMHSQEAMVKNHTRHQPWCPRRATAVQVCTNAGHLGAPCSGKQQAKVCTWRCRHRLRTRKANILQASRRNNPTKGEQSLNRGIQQAHCLQIADIPAFATMLTFATVQTDVQSCISVKKPASTRIQWEAVSPPGCRRAASPSAMTYDTASMETMGLTPAQAPSHPVSAAWASVSASNLRPLIHLALEIDMRLNARRLWELHSKNQPLAHPASVAHTLQQRIHVHSVTAGLVPPVGVGSTEPSATYRPAACQDCPCGSTTLVSGLAPIAHVPIWCAVNTPVRYFCMPAQ